MPRARDLYRVLLRRFGPQGWWPTTPGGKALPVCHPGPKTRGLSRNEKFEICAGAVLTQNTAWTNAAKALGALHQARLMSPEKIARVPPARLARLIRSSGYFRQKAKKLKIFSRHILKHHGGDAGRLLNQPLEKARAELLGIYGLGPETADSMLLYAGGRPVFVVDAYTRRVGNRVGLFKTENYDRVQAYFERGLEKSPALYNEFHALLVALGKDFCRTKPLCAQCPARGLCRTGRNS